MSEVRTQESVDLHGHEGIVFPDFAEESSYLEAVTFPDHDAALARFREEGHEWGDVPALRKVWMRREKRPEGGDGHEAWWECPEDAPGAVPFWKDGPS